MRASRAVIVVTAAVTIAVLGTGVGVVLATPSESSESDSTPPTLQTTPWADFVVGSQVHTGTHGYSDVTRRLAWMATDSSGICKSEADEVTTDGEPSEIASGDGLRSVTVGANDYDGTFGGGSLVVEWWKVIVEDCAVPGFVNNGAYAVVRGGNPSFTQDDGQELGDHFPQVTISYSGTWGVSNCTCWSGGTTRKTSEAGASATITGDFAPRERVGLVMETAPDRGQFDVYIDGTKQTTVDTFAASPTHRVVVWNGIMPAAGGQHVIKLVNLATSGRPRIDLDLVVSG